MNGFVDSNESRVRVEGLFTESCVIITPENVQLKLNKDKSTNT